MDKNKHKFYMARILSLIFKDKDLCNVLAFKGGTSLMFFHNLNRFSTDLDFNLLDPDKLDLAYDKVRAILIGAHECHPTPDVHLLRQPSNCLRHLPPRLPIHSLIEAHRKKVQYG